MAVTLLAVTTVLIAATGSLLLRRWVRRRHRVNPHLPTLAPLSWLWSPFLAGPRTSAIASTRSSRRRARSAASAPSVDAPAHHRRDVRTRARARRAPARAGREQGRVSRQPGGSRSAGRGARGRRGRAGGDGRPAGHTGRRLRGWRVRLDA